jgi:hypothetical protein
MLVESVEIGTTSEVLAKLVSVRPCKVLVRGEKVVVVQTKREEEESGSKKEVVSKSTK